MKLYLAPLEGITGYIFRNSYEKLYGNIDKYFAPFVSPTECCALTPKERKDIHPDNIQVSYLVPQILTCKSSCFIDATKELQQMGYEEINLNLGCPSGTVCAKGKGAGFLPETDKLKSFLDDIYAYGDANNIKISIKTRLGFYLADEFYDLIEIFNDYPVHELIVHPRVRTDYYKGEPRPEYYAYALDHAKCPLVYNGNIFSKDDYDNLCQKLNHNVDTVMIGRGVLANPSLTNELLTGDTNIDFNRFWELHDTLYHEYQKVMSPDINVLFKMRELWTYWKSSFKEIDRDYKHIMKAKKYAEYESILRNLR